MLIDVSVHDMFGDLPNLKWNVGTEFVCNITSEECLSVNEQMTIDKEVKTLLKMLSPEQSYHSIRQPNVQCFFDCGDGFEFHSTPGYNH